MGSTPARELTAPSSKRPLAVWGAVGLARSLRFGRDDHHSPLTANGYFKLRVRPQLRFYKSRLPGYSTMRGSLSFGED
ncbi:hypothetical protein TrLO_g6223 [Triparma laevis f. longispina]|uniref:Uncharacterized protein n=1 Tax=Triparma laevis f. longispina TaxID=1714387 RepID=A0A9W7KZF4_9STRA|nr:hypothetical protein TrLO_g6223 [Triparma laevis f. longispina]